MLWLGDNVYLREDFHGQQSIYDRYTHTSTPEMANLLSSASNYAIWDDHDYGQIIRINITPTKIKH